MGINVVEVFVSDEKAGRIAHRVIGNNTVDFSAVSDKNPKSLGLLPTIYYPNFVFSKEIAAACDNGDIETVAEHYLDRINEVYYTKETKRRTTRRSKSARTAKRGMKTASSSWRPANSSTRSFPAPK